MSDQDSFGAVTADVISRLASNAVKSLSEYAKQKKTEYIAKEDIDCGVAFETYLKRSEQAVRMAKTILYGKAPHNLYEFYECLGIKHRSISVDTSDINNVLEIGNRIIISGTGGIGKSILMKHCFVNCILNTEYVPILLELRGFNSSVPGQISLEDGLYQSLCSYGFELPKDFFLYSLETGNHMILLDGYDEVKSELSQEVATCIRTFGERYPSTPIIVSSRPLGDFVGWPEFIEFETLPLTKEQAISLIGKIDYDPPEIKDQFLRALDESLFKRYKSFASNPLLLTVMLMTYEDRAEIPDSRVDFYEQAFSTLFHKHDAMKPGVYKREKKSGLGYEDFKLLFARFCFRSFFMGLIELSEREALDIVKQSQKRVLPGQSLDSSLFLNDLTDAVCMLTHEGFTYRFSHRSFQEYFAAVYTTQLSDEDQKQFLSSWLREIDGRITSDYLDILRELQTERFIRNVLYDGIKAAMDGFEASGRGVAEFAKTLYSGVIVDELKGFTFPYLVVRPSYLHTLIDQICASSNFRRAKGREPDYCACEEFAAMLVDCYSLDMDRFDQVDIQDLEDDDYLSKLLELLPWIGEKYQQVKDALQIIESSYFGRHQGYDSMLDSL